MVLLFLDLRIFTQPQPSRAVWASRLTLHLSLHICPMTLTTQRPWREKKWLKRRSWNRRNRSHRKQRRLVILRTRKLSMVKTSPFRQGPQSQNRNPQWSRKLLSSLRNQQGAATHALSKSTLSTWRTLLSSLSGKFLWRARRPRYHSKNKRISVHDLPRRSSAMLETLKRASPVFSAND